MVFWWYLLFLTYSKFWHLKSPFSFQYICLFSSEELNKDESEYLGWGACSCHISARTVLKLCEDTSREEWVRAFFKLTYSWTPKAYCRPHITENLETSNVLILENTPGKCYSHLLNWKTIYVESTFLLLKILLPEFLSSARTNFCFALFPFVF